MRSDVLAEAPVEVVDAGWQRRMCGNSRVRTTVIDARGCEMWSAV